MSRRPLAPPIGVLALAIVAAASLGDSSRLAGSWEGTFHGGRGDQPIAIVCRPRGPSRFVGSFYLDGTEIGLIEDGRCSGDSIAFRVESFSCAGHVAGPRMSAALTVTHGRTHTFDMNRTSADTASLPPSAVAGPPPAPARDVAPDSVFRAHAVAPAPVSSTHACLEKGTLLLVGGGPNQEDLDARFLELAGGKAARIVAIPTAQMGSSDSLSPSRFGASVARNLGATRVDVLHTFSRRQADSAAFASPLERATGVWIAGGEGSWLLDSYLGTRTERELIAVLERGGVISGTSAGALVWGSQTMMFRARPGVSEYVQLRLEDLVLDHVRATGVGLLRNVVIVPHFTEHHLEPLLARLVLAHPGLLGLGIDESTAAEVHGDVITVRGRGHMIVFDGREHEGRPSLTLSAGARYDLVR
ncbi:MAG: hypothetical protein AUG74_20695, partial [Bacteroidetes bacterium 13_1_20CM_4_60_6]